MYIRWVMKISLVAPVKRSQPYLENDPAPLLDLNYLRISPWLWFRKWSQHQEVGTNLILNSLRKTAKSVGTTGEPRESTTGLCNLTCKPSGSITGVVAST